MNREKLLSAIWLRENVSEVVASEIIYKNDRSGCRRRRSENYFCTVLIGLIVG